MIQHYTDNQMRKLCKETKQIKGKVNKIQSVIDVAYQGLIIGNLLADQFKQLSVLILFFMTNVEHLKVIKKSKNESKSL